MESNIPNGTPQRVEPEDSVATLLRLAGERMAPRAEPMERARAAAHAAWGKMLERESARRSVPRAWGWAIGLAAAASVVLAVVLFRAPDADAPAVATVERIEGTVLMEPADDAPVALRAGTQIAAGARFVTRDGRLALSLGSFSIRVDRGSTLELGDGELTLQQGAIYVDTGAAAAVPSTLRIVTPEGEVRHLGTQYQVLVQGEKTVVRVREGNVRIDRRDDTHAERVDANEEVVLVRGQSAVRRPVSAHGPEWRWSTEIAPPFDIEGRSLAELLAWLTRENGWQLEYATATARGAAAEVLLHGGRATAASPETLTRIAAITGFSFSAEDGVLRVSDAR